MPRYFKINDDMRVNVTELPRLWIEYKESGKWKKRYYIMVFINGYDLIRYAVYAHGGSWVGDWNVTLDVVVKALEEEIGVSIPEEALDTFDAMLLERKLAGTGSYII